MTGLKQSTVSTVGNEVCEAIFTCMWMEYVESHIPKTDDICRKKVLDVEEVPVPLYLGWSAVDGCHIPIKCPPGGKEACREYHNLKNFYFIILISVVDATYRFVWGSCGFLGNSNDSVILQSTSLRSDIQNDEALPSFVHKENEVNIPPLLVGDSGLLWTGGSSFARQISCSYCGCVF